MKQLLNCFFISAIALITMAAAQNSDVQIIPATTPRLENITFLAEENIISFSVTPGNLDLSQATVGFYAKRDGKVLYLLPLKALAALNQPVIVKQREVTFYKNITEIETITNGQKTVEKPVLYGVDAREIPSGNYELVLQDVATNANNVTYYNSFSVPERTAIIKITHLTTEPVNATVGDIFDFNFSIENTGVVAAQNIPVLVYLKNQQLQITNPQYAVTKNGDKSTLIIPELGPKTKIGVALRFKVVAYDPNPWLNIYVTDTTLIHPDQQNKETGRVIGKIVPGATAAQSATEIEDPATMLVEKRSTFCRAKHGDDGAAIKECTKAQAKADFACLKKPTSAEQLVCIKGFYK